MTIVKELICVTEKNGSRIIVAMSDEDNESPPPPSYKNGNGNYKNGSGNGPYSPKEEPYKDENIVRLPTLAERDRMRKDAEKEARKILSKQEPIIRLPNATKYMLGTFIIIHLTLSFFPDLQRWVILNFGFIPAAFTGAAPFTQYTVLTPLSYMVLHGSWLHLAMNSVMLAAFGSGVERWLGSKMMVLFFIFCSLFGVGLHFIFYTGSLNPVVGASGGLSGFFAAALVMLNARQTGHGFTGNLRNIMPIALLWIGISILFGILGGPDGSNIAWIAHIGGFIGGFVILKFMKKL